MFRREYGGPEVCGAKSGVQVRFHPWSSAKQHVNAKYKHVNSVVPAFDNGNGGMGAG